MGQFDIRIPEWAPPDIGGPLNSIAQHEDELRKMAEAQQNTDRKLSADAARTKWEQDQKLAEQKQADDIARSNMLMPNSPLMQAAGAPNADPSRMNAIGSPYGISFETPAAQGVSSAGSTGDAIQKMFNPALSSPVVPPDAGPEYGPPTPAVIPPASGPPSPGDALGPLGAAATPPVPVDTSPNPDIEATANALGAEAPTMRHMYAKVNGQRFEVAPSSNTTGLGAEYDHLYESIVPHVGQEKAMALVIAKAEKDNAASAVADRVAGTRAHQDEVNQQYRLTADEQKKLHSQPLDNAEREKLAAIRNGGGAGMALPDPKAQNAWLSVHKQGVASGLVTQAVRNRQIFDRFASELDAGQPPNAALQKTALHSLATISTSMGGTGNRVAVSVIKDINEANGLIDSAENYAYKALHHGQNMPRIVEVYRSAGARLRQLQQEEARKAYDAVDSQSGNKSVFGQHPQLGPIVGGAMHGLAIDLGIDDAKGATPAASAPVQGTPHADPVGTTKTLANGKVVRKVGPNNWQPVTP